MAYIETIKKGKKKYYYITQTVRLGNKFKKVRWFLGRGEIPKQKLKQVADLYREKLKQKVAGIKNIRKIVVLDEETTRKLNQINQNYKSLVSKISKIEYQVIEKQHLIRFTFNTNAIEGSTITLKETGHILEDGISPEGKDLREIHEIENTKKAYDFMRRHKGKINLNFIKKIYYNLTYNILENDAGRFRRIQVYMGGSKHVPTRASAVSKELSLLMRWVKNHENLHQIELAAYVHHFFIAIHPFLDGNGRTGRLLLNFMLMKSGFPPICIKKEERIKYTDYLEEARDGNITKFLQFIAEKVFEAHAEFVDTIK